MTTSPNAHDSRVEEVHLKFRCDKAGQVLSVCLCLCLCLCLCHTLSLEFRCDKVGQVSNSESDSEREKRDFGNLHNSSVPNSAAVM